MQENQGLLSHYLSEQRMYNAKPFLSGRVLDFGCSGGSLTKFLSPVNYLGFDINAQSIIFAKQSHPNYNFTNRIEDIQLGSFDTVVALAVIEHVKDPVQFLINLCSYLRPVQSSGTNSKIVISTPAPFSEKIHYFGAKLGLFSQEANEEHEALIGKKEIIHLASQANLQLKVSKRFLFGVNQLFILEKCIDTQ